MGNVKSNESGQRNYAIEFYRFLFSCIIFVLHVRKFGNLSDKGAFCGGYLVVEFFFILSGFFMMADIQKRQGKLVAGGGSHEFLTVRYFILKYKRLMPHYWLSLIVLLLVDCAVFTNFNIKEAVLKALPEIFCLQTFWCPNEINHQLWFISALLWASALVYYLVLRWKDFMICIFFPVGMLAFISYIYNNIGYIDITDNSVFYLAPFARAFFEIGFGCVLYQVFVKVREHCYNRVLMSAVEIVLLFVILIVMWRTRRGYMDFIMVFLLGALILITALNQGILSIMLNHRVSGVLGAVSYPVYVNQLMVQRFAQKYYSIVQFWTMTFVALLATILYAGLITQAFHWIRVKKAD